MEYAAGVTEKEITHTDKICRNTKQVMSKFLGDKEEEWAAVTRNGPLNLLDLPVDVLKEIIREVSCSPGNVLLLRSLRITGYPHE